MYLDTLEPIYATVGWGALGRGGSLGYGDQPVRVGGSTFAHALSTHAPARLLFELGGRYATFRARVAMNDDVPHGFSRADFYVIADGRRVAAVERVEAGASARDVVADLAGARTLELAVHSAQRDYSHAVWLEPYLDPLPAPPPKLVDCLGRAEISVRPFRAAERCIATVVTAGFEDFLDDMLGSLIANGGCAESPIVVFIAGESRACEAVAAKYAASVVHCRNISKGGTAIKSILYSIAHVVPARQYLCLDADMLITGDLAPLFAALDVLPPKSVLVCRDCNNDAYQNLGHVLRANYGGTQQDAARLAITEEEQRYPLVVNDGLFAASRTAMIALDAEIRSIPGAAAWMDERDQAPLRNQFLFNLALARSKAGVAIDDTWNVQLHSQSVDWDPSTRRAAATWNGRPARVVHFSGGSKRKYPEAQRRYSSVARPLLTQDVGGGDGYAAFLRALRGWLGVHGADALRWSFYGTVAGDSSTVRDPSVFPLFGALHYLIRSNGCARVLEAGTARGVSAACIASAIAHRDGARLVTFDPEHFDGRDELWRALPPQMSAVIEARQCGSVEGMRAALDAGERYDAALLDSLHVEEHVWNEFELARQLVCAGGLILIHDATYAPGTVDRALKRIEQSGYGVARLWTAECGVPEDDRLGLAVIENRRRSA